MGWDGMGWGLDWWIEWDRKNVEEKFTDARDECGQGEARGDVSCRGRTCVWGDRTGCGNGRAMMQCRLGAVKAVLINRRGHSEKKKETKMMLMKPGT